MTSPLICSISLLISPWLSRTLFTISVRAAKSAGLFFWLSSKFPYTGYNG